MKKKRTSLIDSVGNKSKEIDPNAVEAVLKNALEKDSEEKLKNEKKVKMPTVKLTAMIDQELFWKMKMYCAQKKTKIRDLLEKMLHDKLEDRDFLHHLNVGVWSATDEVQKGSILPNQAIRYIVRFLQRIESEQDFEWSAPVFEQLQKLNSACVEAHKKNNIVKKK